MPLQRLISFLSICIVSATAHATSKQAMPLANETQRLFRSGTSSALATFPKAPFELPTIPDLAPARSLEGFSSSSPSNAKKDRRLDGYSDPGNWCFMQNADGWQSLYSGSVCVMKIHVTVGSGTTLSLNSDRTGAFEGHSGYKKSHTQSNTGWVKQVENCVPLISYLQCLDACTYPPVNITNGSLPVNIANHTLNPDANPNQVPRGCSKIEVLQNNAVHKKCLWNDGSMDDGSMVNNPLAECSGDYVCQCDITGWRGPAIIDGLSLDSQGNPQQTLLFYVNGGELILNNLILRNGRIDLYSLGAIAAGAGSNVVVNQTIFRDNFCVGLGGALNVNGVGTTLLLQDSTFESNIAGNGGAFVAFGGASVSMVGTNTFKKNIAAGSGGAFYVAGLPIALDGPNSKLVLEENSAATGGGAFFLLGASMSASNGATVVCDKNTATGVAGQGGCGWLLSSNDLQSQSSLSIQGRNTNLVMRENSATLNGGGLMVQGATSRAAAITVSNAARLDCSKNTATMGGCMMLPHDEATLTVRGKDTEMVVDGNIAVNGGGFAQQSAAITVESGAVVQLKNNVATGSVPDGYGAGFSLVTDTSIGIPSSLTITGNNTRVVVENGIGKNGVGISADTKCLVSIEDCAVLELKNNTAVNSGAGIKLFGQASLSISGDNSLLLLDGNHAQDAAGIFALMASTVTVEKGATLKATNNVATFDGGGMTINQENTLLTVTGASSSLIVENNSALNGNGGGMGIRIGGLIRIPQSTTPPTVLFKGNQALKGSGGAFSYLSTSVSEDGSTQCVNVLLTITADATAASSNILVETLPKSPLASTSWDDLVGATGTKTSQWCIPCGEYLFNIGTMKIGKHFGNLAKITMKLADREQDVFPTIDTELRSGETELTSPEPFLLSCVDQGVMFANARFEDNIALKGGALGMSPFFKNSYYDIRASSFINNKAIGNGGAVYVSGQNSGLKLSEGCLLENNAAIDGAGGALAIENSALLHINSATGTNNSAPHGVGGFLHGSFASPILLRNVQLTGNSARGGGAVSVLGTSIAMETVLMKNSIAGEQGGGALRLAKGSEGHLISGCDFINNKATNGGPGGHVSASASKLIVHDEHAALEWPALAPHFPRQEMLGNTKYVLFENGASCESHEHYESITDAAECEETNITLATALHSFEGLVNTSTSGAALCPSHCILVQNPNRLMNRADVERVLFKKMYNSNASSTAFCTTRHPCVCRKKIVGQASSMIDGKTSSSSAGALFCSASTLPTLESKAIDIVSKEEASVCESSFKYQMVQDWSKEWEHACFGDGVYIGQGTVIRGSESSGGNKQNGGGAVATNLCDVTVNGATFDNNVARGKNAHGGAILLKSFSRLVGTNTVFTNNTAEDGSGGAVACDGCNRIDLSSGTVLTNNVAGIDGGALFVSNPALLLTSSQHSVFKGNKAGKNGGAVFVVDTAFEGLWRSDGDSFEENTATDSGGALATAGVHITLKNATTCTKNLAHRGGGGCIMWESLAPNAQSSLWQTLAPSVADTVMTSNAALFGNDFATPGVTLRAFANTTHWDQVVSALFGGNILAPSPVVEVLDLYGNIVRGSHASSIEVDTTCRDEKVQIYGAISKPIESSSGQSTFDSFGIRSEPSSGPHQLVFEAKITIAGGLVRALNATSLGVFVDACNQHFYSEKQQDGTMICKKCPARATSVKGSTNITQCVCESGFYLQNSQCQSCPARSISPKGSTDITQCVCDKETTFFDTDHCQTCPVNSVLVNTVGPVLNACHCIENYHSEEQQDGTMICKKCSDDKTSILGSSQCVCRRDKYYTSDTQANTCESCPKGADCSAKDNVTVADMYAKPGYWRTGAESIEFLDCSKGYKNPMAKNATANNVSSTSMATSICCPNDQCNSKHLNQTDLAMDLGLQCKKGYTSIMCMSCTKDHVRVNNACEPCAKGSKFSDAMNGVIAVCGIFFFLFLVIFLRADEKDETKKKEDDKKDDETDKRGKQLKRQHTDAVSRFAADQNYIERAAMTYKNGKKVQSNFGVISNRLKILYSWLQIFSCMTITYDSVGWPPMFTRVTLTLGVVVNMDVMAMLDVAACTYSIPYLQKFLLHMLLPIFIALAVLIARIFSYLIRRTATQRREQTEAMYKIILAFVMILYPGLCTRVFSVLRCRNIYDDFTVLSDDYSVACWVGEHETNMIVALVFMGVYIIGIPLGLFIFLCKNVSIIQNPEKNPKKYEYFVDAFGSVFLQYEPGFWYYEIFVLTKKMLLTGAIMVIAPGSSAQLLIAILIVLFFMLSVLKMSPFEADADDWLSFCTSLQLMLSLLLAFALITDDDPNQQEYDRRQMDITLIVVNSFAFILLILSLCGLIPCVRNRINKRAERIARSKVIPTDGGGGGDGENVPSDMIRNWTMSNEKPAENSTQKIPPPPAEKIPNLNWTSNGEGPKTWS